MARFQVAMRGRQHPHVHRDLFVPADALNVFLLKHAQELDLGAQAQVADFVEKNRAVVGLLEAAQSDGRARRYMHRARGRTVRFPGGSQGWRRN